MSHSPIFDAIQLHNAKNRVSFHTPSHKGVADCLSVLGDVLAFDTTELPDTGSLFDGIGATAQAEALAAQLFETKTTFLVSGGCTLCIQAMLRLAMPNAGKLIAGRTIHRSAVNAMALLGIEPIWVWNRADTNTGIAGRIYAQDVETAILNNSDAKAVYITTPDYYGVMSDIRKISEVANRYGLPVIVDNAHGAHLKFIDGDLHPLSRGAVMSADSAHKTLPVMTGGAWLNIADEKDVSNARGALSLFASTSPSYPILLSLDLCRVWLEQYGKQAMSATIQQVAEIKAFARNLGFDIPSGECDPMRICLYTEGYGIRGTDAAQILREHGIEPEYADAGSLIFIPSALNTVQDFKKLKTALYKLPKGEKITAKPYLPNPPKVLMSLREALLSESERIEVRNAKGRIAAEIACPCPPAIPVVMQGEEINKGIIDCLEHYGLKYIKVVKN